MKKKLMHILILSCRKATLLIEKSQAMPLGIIDKLQLRVHLKLCDGCNQYQKQSLFIEDLLRKDTKNFSDPDKLKLSEKSKSLIQKVIEENLKK
ncbi:MAG TPA: hypothetical protein PL029_02975 [Bacteroidia bacterium]|nr:hypothetical protein [Bacteroidia bacterium]